MRSPAAARVASCFLSGEGDGDAAVFVLGMITGAALAHNFTLAGQRRFGGEGRRQVGGLSSAGMGAVILGLVVCVVIGFTMRERVPRRRQHATQTGLVQGGCAWPLVPAAGYPGQARHQRGPFPIEVLVDSVTSRENVRRMAEKAGLQGAVVQTRRRIHADAEQVVDMVQSGGALKSSATLPPCTSTCLEEV